VERSGLDRLMAWRPPITKTAGAIDMAAQLGLCRAGEQDLGAAMVSTGMAWAFTRYSSDYVAEEKAAIGSRLGVHAHDCMNALD
jgi:endonuclease YncB( thermonuclease family)